ncbi:MAG: Bro-N domain-containing protein [Dehalococcoidia bacterium]|nr:Bro-N domain-containing protein [Dehalococcoidia bacterium]
MQATKEVTLFQQLGIFGFMDDTGEPWFLLKEVCRAAEMENNPHLKDRINPKDMLSKQTLTTGGMQDMVYVNERGFYAAIGGSRKAKARQLVQALLSHLPKMREEMGLRVAELEAQIKELRRGGDHLLVMPVADISHRARVNMIIRKFIRRQTGGYSYPDAWHELYYQLYYRYGIDLKARARKRGLDPLDCATPEEMQKIVNLAEHIFRAAE